MKREVFDTLAAQNYNRIPIVHEVLADLDTPLSVYLKLAHGAHSYLFESVQGGEKWGRYSIIGLPCRTVLRVYGKHISVSQGAEVLEQLQANDPLDFVHQFKARYRVPELPGIPRVAGGLVGYFGYETVGYIEPRVARMDKPDDIGTPDILLMVSDEVVVFDNLAGKLYLVVHADPAQDGAYDAAQQRIAELSARLGGPIPTDGITDRSARDAQPVQEDDFKSGISREDFEAAVQRAREYIRDGDIMQVVLSQRLSIRFSAPPLNLYRALRTLNPSPYMYFLNLEDFHIVGSSPEILARLEGDTITLRPIAGTRPRGQDEAQDQALERDLLSDPKELAEHLMLVDLGRNDVGRVASIGSVKVTDQMSIERYSHVMHIVSNVTGSLLPGKDAIDVLRATFPAGTLSGAPKVRAMEIIDELEPVKRGVYAGAVGYLAWNGNMDTAIAIRTAVIKHGTLNIQAGAGIVADSIPANEWEETMNKARAIFRAVSMCATGLGQAASPGSEQE